MSNEVNLPLAPNNRGTGGISSSPTPPQLGAGGRSAAGTLWVILTAVFTASSLLPLPGQNGQIAHLPSVCPFYNLTGLPCPGCGLTRAFVCLGHGQWQASLHWHPLGWLIYWIFALLWLRAGAYWLHGVTLLPLSPRTSSHLGWAATIVLLAFGLARIGWLTAHHLRF